MIFIFVTCIAKINIFDVKRAKDAKNNYLCSLN